MTIDEFKELEANPNALSELAVFCSNYWVGSFNYINSPWNASGNNNRNYFIVAKDYDIFKIARNLLINFKVENKLIPF